MTNPTKEEFFYMALSAVGSYREIKKRDAELAEELFCNFRREFKQLAKCIKSFHSLQDSPPKRKLKSRLESVNACIDFQNELVSDTLNMLKRAAT